MKKPTQPPSKKTVVVQSAPVSDKRTDDIEPLLTEAQVLEILNVSRTTLWRELKDGAFPEPIRIANVKRWKPSTIRDYLNGGRPE